jgi:hypothetical protein
VEGCRLAAHGINADPQVVSAANRDFHLQSGSPAIDEGLAIGADYSADRDGNPRPLGAGWDIGAYER